MILTFLCNGLTRRLQKVENAVVAVRQDNSVDTIRIAMRQEEFNNIDLSEVSVKMLYVDEEGTTKAYQTGTAPVDGVYYANWELTSDVVDAEGNVTFALKLAIVENGDVVKEWFSIPETFRVYDSLDDSNNPPGETESEQATNAERIAQLTSELGTTNANLETLGTEVDTLSTTKANIALTYLDGQDLDTILTSGEYYSRASVNKPTGASTVGYLTVLQRPNANTETKQVYRSYNSNEKYVRTRTSGTWGEWEKVPSRKEIPLPPTTAGTYRLTCTVSSGTATYSWEPVVDSEEVQG